MINRRIERAERRVSRRKKPGNHRGNQRGNFKKGCGIQQRLAALVNLKLFEHLRRDLIGDRQGKQSSKDHISGGVAGLGLNFHRRCLCDVRMQACDGLLACCPRRWKSLFHPIALKRRVNNAPLALPFGTVGQKNTLAQKRLQAGANTVGFLTPV